LSPSTQQLALQLVKSTAVYKKYRKVLEDHNREKGLQSPSISPTCSPTRFVFNPVQGTSTPSRDGGSLEKSEAGQKPTEMLIKDEPEIVTSDSGRDEDVASDDDRDEEVDLELSKSAIEMLASKGIEEENFDMTASIDSSRPRPLADDTFTRSKTTDGRDSQTKSRLDDSYSRSQTGGDLREAPKVSAIDDNDTFLRSKTGGDVSEVNMTANLEEILADSELCEPIFEMQKMDSLMRRGSLEHVKGRVGSFWGQSAISGKSRIMSIYSKGGDSNVDSMRKAIPEDDSFLDF